MSDDNVMPFKPKRPERKPRLDTPDVFFLGGDLFMPEDAIRFDLTTRQVHDLIFDHLADEGLIDYESWAPGDYPVVVVVKPEEGEKGVSQYFAQYVTVPE